MLMRIFHIPSLHHKAVCPRGFVRLVSVTTKPLTPLQTHLCFSLLTVPTVRLKKYNHYPRHYCDHRQDGSNMSLAPYPIIPEQLSDGSSHPANHLGQPSHRTQSVPHWQQYFSKSSNDLISRYAHSSPWNPSTINWPENTALPSHFRGVDPESRLSASGLATHGQYPESSQRTSIPSSSSSSSQAASFSLPLLSNLPLPTSSERGLASAPAKLNELWGSQLYTINDTESPESPRLPSRDDTSTPSVKQEPDDSEDGFIMEFSNPLSSPSVIEHNLAPPTEVPLRATQASKEMRKMMGVFRLNPFTMHNSGGRGTHVPSWNGEDAGPLEEEPQLYEFQLVVEDVEPSSDDELRSFSPDFELASGSVESDCSPQDEWAEYNARGIPHPSSRRPSVWDHPRAQIYPSPTGTSASLELEYPDSSTDQQPGASFSFKYPFNGFAAQHELSASASSSYAGSSSSSEMPRMPRRDPGPKQTWNDYLSDSRPSSSVGVSESAGARGTNIPVHSGPGPAHYLQTGSALSISTARRWSLRSEPQAPFLL